MKILRSSFILILLLFLVPLILGYDYGVDLSDVTSEDDLRDLVGDWDSTLEQYEDDQITNDEYETLKDLFNSPVDLNTADREELHDLPEVTHDLADRIIEYRERYGSFKRPEDVKKVSGVEDVYPQIEPFIKVETKRLDGGCALQRMEKY